MDISMDIVQKYIESVLKPEVLEDSFKFHTIPNDDIKTNSANCPGMKRILLSISTSSEPDIIIKHYVDLIADVQASSKFDVLFNTLKLLVSQHHHLGKAVCEALLSCDKLHYYNQNLWRRSFALISEILPNVDYKGVRDILKLILEIIYRLPDSFDSSFIPQINTLHSTFSKILDRQCCLLPAYLSLDELQKKIIQSGAPHWNFDLLFYDFIESFKPTAQIFSISNRPDLLPVVGVSTCQANPSWRLDPISAKFQLKGLLPYRQKLKEPQVGHVRYIIEQPYSREMVCSILSLSSKQPQIRCSELIEQLAILIVHMMEKSELNIESYDLTQLKTCEHLFQWTDLSNNILFYIVHNQANISFNQLVDSLCEKIKPRNLKRGREHLMWAILQCITGMPVTTSKSVSLNDFLVVLKLFDILYSGRTPLPLLPEDFPLQAHVLAGASLWMQLAQIAESEQVKLPRPLPPSLKLHYDYVKNLKQSEDSYYSISLKNAVALNAHIVLKAHLAPNGNVVLNPHIASKNGFSTENMVDYLTKIDPVNNPNPALSKPLPVALLDSLSAQTKYGLVKDIANRIIYLSQSKQGIQSNYMLTSGLIETYGRLMVYTDNDSFGVRTYINHLLGGKNPVLQTHAWHVYHVLLEMYNHRVQHVPIQCKYQMLIHLHMLLPKVYSYNLMQLCLTMEATELKLLLGLSNFEALNMPIGNARLQIDPKTAKHMIGESEELNKVLVLVVARSTHVTASEHVTASFLEELLNDVNKVTPLSWSSSTSNFFPSTIKDFFARNASNEKTDRAQLRPAVEEEYRKWKAMANEGDLVAHFSQPSGPPLFICILWKMLLENDHLNPVVYRILDNIRIRTLSAHLRTFVDYLVYEFANSVGGQLVNKYAEALNFLIWKYQIISLDRLLLCMCLRSFDGCEAQVCFFIIQLLLLKISDFRATVQKFCKMQSAEHWKQESNCFEVNGDFQRRHPEKCYHDFLNENNIPSQGQTLPSFFSNVCLRFIPVFDILIHRALELRILSPNAAIKIDVLLDEFGCLYKFHEKPLTYLYNTLHYYDSQLPAALKKKLTSTIVGALDEGKPPNWCLSESFIQYLRIPNNQGSDEWVPNQDYYRDLIGRLVDCLQSKKSLYHTDWRYNEFLNSKAHAVHSTAIELMALPLAPTVVGNAILDLVLGSYYTLDRTKITQWMNAIGLVMAALPPSYYTVLNTKILDYMKSSLLTNPEHIVEILNHLNFSDNHERYSESQTSYLVALTHAIWQHSSTGQIFCLPSFWRSEIKKTVETESQFLFVCCLIGPFLPRLERSRVMMDVVVELYEMLGKVDSSSDIQHLYTICDFLYHIKYMFTGDAVKSDLERYIKNFKPNLQCCLRFITHLNLSNEQHQKSD